VCSSDLRVAGLDVEFTLSASPFHHGGPVVGLGGTFGDGGGFRMRFGWEVAAPDWLLYSFNADTDFEERLVLAPVIEAATPSFLGIIPSASLGLGVPIRVVPIAHVGMRSQAAINFAYVGFVTSVDWYPGISSGDPDHLDVTLMGRLSL
ncbi:MAG: hypothetical protein VB934_12090, partial [Polyangiaceae bacterium]